MAAFHLKEPSLHIFLGLSPSASELFTSPPAPSPSPTGLPTSDPPTTNHVSSTGGVAGEVPKYKPYPQGADSLVGNVKPTYPN